jgi:putative ABC transport system ATP-binding protein
MDKLIICENLVKIYQQDGIEVMALQGLDLQIKSGDMVGVVGASGSGKTTLLNVLGGLDRPSAGKAVVDGQDLLKSSDSQMDVYRKQKVGFIWQQPGRNLLPYLSAMENVMLPMWLAGVKRLERRKRAEELLDSLGFAGRKHHKPVQLSGGEQQRTAIAVALANRPILLLADEPTGEVDSATARDVYHALYQATAEYGATTIIVSHDPLLSRYTQRVVTIRDGKTSTEKVRLEDVEKRLELGESTGPSSERRTNRSKSPQELEESPETEEYILLDSAGRLQVPKHILEALNISNRVRLELKNDIAVLHRVDNPGREINDNRDQTGDRNDGNPVFPKEVLPGIGGAVLDWWNKAWKKGKK